MHPELFTIPVLNVPVSSFGLMMVIGFLLAVQLAKVLARRKGLDPEVFVNAALIALLSGIVGARLSHVLENIAQYTDPSRSVAANLWDAVNLRSGGLTFFGGLLLAIPITMLYGRWKRVPIRTGMDIIAPCILIGLAFGRVGCFLNGCCYGAQCELPWAVTYPYGSYAQLDHAHDGVTDAPAALVFHVPGGRERLLSNTEVEAVEQIGAHLATRPRADVRAMLIQDGGGTFADEAYTDAILDHAERYGDADLTMLASATRSAPVHPAQLYSTFNALLIAAVLVAFFTLSPAPGRVFSLMLILKGASRYVLEMLRTEPAVLGRGTDVLALLPPHSFSMVMGAGLFIAGVVLWFAFRGRPDGQGDQPDTAAAPAAPATA